MNLIDYKINIFIGRNKTNLELIYQNAINENKWLKEKSAKSNIKGPTNFKDNFDVFVYWYNCKNV